MKIKNDMTLTSLAATGSKLDLAIADARGEIKLTVLTPARPKRGQLVYTSGHRSTGVRAAGVKIRGGNGHNCGSKVA